MRNAPTLAAVVLLLAQLCIGESAHAQTPTQEPATVAPKINLTLEQRHIIKEIVKDLKIAPAPAKQDISLGTEVPSTIKLEPMPAQVSAKVPQIRSHLFFVEDSKIILVEAKDRKIVDVIE